MTEIIDPTIEAKKNQAVQIAHQLFVVDSLLKIKSSEHHVEVTIGWDAPNDALLPVATLLMPRDFAAELGDALAKAAALPTKTHRRIK